MGVARSSVAWNTILCASHVRATLGRESHHRAVARILNPASGTETGRYIRSASTFCAAVTPAPSSNLCPSL